MMNVSQGRELVPGDKVVIEQGRFHTPGWVSANIYTVLENDPKHFGARISQNPERSGGSWIDYCYLEQIT